MEEREGSKRKGRKRNREMKEERQITETKERKRDSKQKEEGEKEIRKRGEN